MDFEVEFVRLLARVEIVRQECSAATLTERERRRLARIEFRSSVFRYLDPLPFAVERLEGCRNATASQFLEHRLGHRYDRELV
ncbi:hypothetical protein I7X12_09250 [Halosimplex litoreum]|uniref:Uncharacterized protein n=1 Tax=Halosimplex litoreum TaxID=1198301 RepID=A0A7U3WAX1_9EURY|nr:hypothetical protein [Halosimplex litoreum]QPV64766.1 hypothetical protein I7X12_09250 [Halosimplex litoreum]